MKAQFTKPVEDLSLQEIASLLEHLAIELRNRPIGECVDAGNYAMRAVAVLDKVETDALARIKAWQEGQQ